MANYGNFYTLAVNEYTPMIFSGIQQLRSRTAQFMPVYGMASRQRRFQIISPVSSEEVLDYYSSTNPQQPDFSMRWLKTKTYKTSHEISRVEMLKAGTIDSPLPRIVQSEAAEMARRRDRVAIDGIIGTAWTGENGDTQVAFDETNNTIKADYGGTAGTATKLTFEKLLRAKTIFGNRNVLGQDVEPQELGGAQMIVLCTHEELASLMGIEKFTNILYNTNRPIGEGGNIVEVMGIRFVAMSPDMLPVGSRSMSSGTGTNIRSLVAFTPNSVAFGILEDMFVRIEELPTNQYVWQTYTEVSMGATRIEDKGVLKIDVLAD